MIKTTNKSVIIDEALSMKEHLENEFKEQFIEKSKYTDIMMIVIPLSINEAINTLVHMKKSHINMLT